MVLRGFGQSPGTATQPPAQAQPATPSTSKVEMPADPAALLEMAAKKNGLQNAGTEPLHIKATYELLDDKGGVKEKGTIEELRVSAKIYKLRYSSPSFDQTDYSTAKGLFRVGDPKWPDTPIWEAHNILYPEFPSGDVIAKSKMKFVEKKAGNVQLRCVSVNSPKTDGATYQRAYCFDPAAPILRLLETYQGANEIIYNSIVPVRGAYIGGDAGFFQHGKALVGVHLDVLNAVPHVEESELTPPSGAQEITRRIEIGSVVTAKPVHETKPEYPAIAIAAKIQGTVVLQAIVGKDGRVVEIRVVGGPPMLQLAAIDAVRQWVYEPYLLDGEPVEVATQINVVFGPGVLPPSSIH